LRGCYALTPGTATAAGVVFDETHFGRFTNQYMAGAYLFDMCVGGGGGGTMPAGQD
jgi:dolichyl-phosphate-mannose--protein O-mannosyl transferase